MRDTGEMEPRGLPGAGMGRCPRSLYSLLEDTVGAAGVLDMNFRLFWIPGDGGVPVPASEH